MPLLYYDYNLHLASLLSSSIYRIFHTSSPSAVQIKYNNLKGKDYVTACTFVYIGPVLLEVEEAGRHVLAQVAREVNALVLGLWIRMINLLYK